jgi:glycosyltransferase involved in cell wall biosynthesis
MSAVPAKVVRITARLNVGGIARHVAWLTAGLRPNSSLVPRPSSLTFESVLVTGKVPPGEDDMSSFALAQGIEPLHLPLMSREISVKDLLTVWQLYRLFVRLRPALIHTHSAKAGAVGRVAGMLYRWLTPGALLGRPRPCRFVHTYHGHVFHSYYGPAKTRLFLWIEKLLARLATDRIIVISQQQYHEIHEKFGVGQRGQVVIIPLGLDLDPYADWPARRHLVRNELAATDEDILVGIVGRLTEIKNHALFLRMAALFQKVTSDEWRVTREDTSGSLVTRHSSLVTRKVRFVVIGNGHLRQPLEAQARELGLGDAVTFLGTRADPENFYPALDIVALTSRNEGTPLTLIEAMANARPVIATGVGGVVDLLGPARQSCLPEGYTLCERGILVRPDDAQAFCRGLTRLVADEVLRPDLGKRGRVFIERHYSRERLLEDVANLYAELLKPKRSAVSSLPSAEENLPTSDL